MVISGLILATVSSFILYLLPGTVLIVISGFGYIINMLLFAIALEDSSYWTYIFLVMIYAIISIDMTFNISNVFITTSIPKA